MSDLSAKLSPFVRRIRWLRAWHGFGKGAFSGAVVALGLAVLDWSRVLYTDWRYMASAVVAGGLVGAVVGFLTRPTLTQTALSLDRRCGLKDRLGTATEEHSDSVMGQAQVQDAEHSVTGLVPRQVYPLSVGRWQLAALAGMVLAASVFLLGNSPAVRGPKTQAEREELKQLGEKVERVAKPLEKPVTGVPMTEGRKKVASELNRFAQELKQGKLNKEEALRKANDMAKKAEQEAKKDASQAEKSTETASTKLAKFEKSKLEESGVSDEDLENLKLSEAQQATLEQEMANQGFQSQPSKFSAQERQELGVSESAERLAQMTPEQRERLRQAIEQRQKGIQEQIDKMDKLSPEERKAQEQEMKRLQQEMKEMQELMNKLKMGEETLKALRELMNSEEMKKLREALSKMQQNAQQMQQGQPLTEEQIKEMQRMLEELEKAMKDPELRKQILDQMKEAMRQMQAGQLSQQAMMQMMAGFGLLPMDGPSGPGDGGAFLDTGKVNKSEHEMETPGKTRTTSVSGQWDDKRGEQWSVTVKAPTQVGNRSSVPYQQVLPRYKGAAEKALNTGKIPKGKEKRVKEYFESLAGGGR